MRIAIMLADLFDDVDYSESVGAFRDKGYEIVPVGLRKGTPVKGRQEGAMLRIEEAARDLTHHDFDAMLIPGGYSPDILRADMDAVRLVRDVMESGQPLLTVGHGPQLLISARVLQGRTLTANRSIREDLRNAGVTFLDREVVIDDNLISCRGTHDLPAFIQIALHKLAETAAHC